LPKASCQRKSKWGGGSRNTYTIAYMCQYKKWDALLDQSANTDLYLY